MEKKLTFSYDWNHKLSCNYFTSIRVDSSRFLVGEIWDIYLGGKYPRNFKAELVKVVRVNPKQLNSTMLMLDTGYPEHEAMKILRNMYKDNFDNLTFAYLIFRNISACINDEKNL